jgi:hypothetical protein
MSTDVANLTLWYGPVFIGTIQDSHQHQGTFFGTFTKHALVNDEPLVRRLRDFIQFCEEWNERTLNKSHPPDPAEFDKYSDLLTSGLWITNEPTGEIRRIVEAPVFFKQNEVTWTEALQR